MRLIENHKDQLIKHRDELRRQAREIRHSSAGLSGKKLRDAQARHRRLSQRITEINEEIQNS